MAERCNGQGELVFSYVEGALAADEAEQFRRHLDECAACRRLHADFQRVAERARLLPPGETPEQEERVLRTKARFTWNAVKALPVLLIMAVAVGGFWYWNRQPSVEPPQIEYMSPSGVEGLEPGDRLRFIFTKDMDHGSVAAALRVEPALRLLTTWDGRTLDLTLPPDVQRPATYEISIGTEATDVDGNPLAEPVTLRFSTSPPPDVLVFGEAVPWSAEEVTGVQLQVDAGTYDFRSTPEKTVERDLGWMLEPEERAEYGEPVVTEEHLHRVIVELPRVDGRGYMRLTLERLGGKRDTDPWFVTYREEYLTGAAAAEAGADGADDGAGAADESDGADGDGD